MTSVNVTTTKNTVTVNGETRVVTVKTAGPQGPAFANGTYGDIVVSNDGADLNIAPGAIVNADISNSAAIQGSKITPAFGSQNVSTGGNFSCGGGQFTFSNDAGGTIRFLDTNNNPDFNIRSSQGTFHIGQSVDEAIFKINTDKHVDINYNLDLAAGLDVTGVITGTSHLDLPDDAVLKLGNSDDFQIFHQASNGNSIIKENGGGVLSIQTNGSNITFYDIANSRYMAQFITGGACIFRHGATTRLQTTSTGIDVTGDISVSGTVDNRDLAADGSKLDTYEADGGSYLRSDADDSFTGTLTGTSDTVNPVIQINGVGPNFIRFDSGANTPSDSIDLIYRTTPNTLAFERVSDSQIMFSVDADDQQAIFNGNVDCKQGLDVFGGDITGTLGSGVTGTTQSAGDNSTKIATTAYTDTAISNLVDSSPDALNTLNELAAALGDDANFSTTVTNSIADKLPLSGGILTGDLSISEESPAITFTDNSGTTNDPDYKLQVNNGRFIIHDKTNNVTRFAVQTDGTVDVGGNLDVGAGIDVTGNLTLPDNGQLQLGGATGGDLKIYHDSQNSYIQETGEGNLFFDASYFTLRNGDATSTVATFADGTGAVGGCRLHFGGATTPKLATLSTGVIVDGQVDINSASYARTMYQFSGTNMWSVGLRASASGDTNYHIFREAGHTGEVEIGAKINANGGLGVTGGITYSTTSVASGTLEFASTLASYDPTEDGGGSETSTTTPISLMHGHSIAVNRSGYLRNLLKIDTETNGSHIEIGRSSTDYIGDIKLLPGNGHKVIANYDGSSKLETSANGIDINGTTTIEAGAFAANINNVGGRTLATNIDIQSVSARTGIVVRNVYDYRTDSSPLGGFQVWDPFDSSSTSYAFLAAEGVTLVDKAWIKTNGTAYFAGNVDMASGLDVTGKATMTESAAIADTNLRKITTSTSAPTSSDGGVGDIWIVYPS